MTPAPPWRSSHGALAFPAAVVIVALFFVAAVLLPHFLQHFDREYPFQGVHIMPADAEVHYAARVREIYDGFWQTGNTFYSAPKNQPYLQPPFPEMVPAVIALLLKRDPVSVFLWWKGATAFVLILVFIGCLSALTGRKWESIVAVTMVLFAGALLAAPWDLPRLLFGELPGIEVLRFSRPINPLWTCIWFFGAVWLMARWMRDRRITYLLGVAGCITVLVYSYVYAWTYLAAALGCLFLWCLWQRDWNRILYLLLLGCIVGPLGLPYFLHVLATLHHPLYAETVIRLGVVSLRTPVLGVWGLIFLVITLLSRSRWPATWPLLPSLALGGILAINQHVLTGTYLVPHHYYWYFLSPLAMMSFVLLAFDVCRPWIAKRWRLLLGGALLMGSVAFGFLWQQRAYGTVRADWGRYQSYGPILTYLSEHTGPGDVVGSLDRSLLDLVPIYTGADVYASANANNYLVSLERARSVYFFSLWLNGVDAKAARQDFQISRRAELSSALYAIHYRELAGSYDAIPDALVAEHADAYEEYLRLSLEEKFGRYPLHFFVRAPEDPDTQALRSLIARGKVVLSQDDYAIVALR